MEAGLNKEEPMVLVALGYLVAFHDIGFEFVSFSREDDGKGEKQYKT